MCHEVCGLREGRDKEEESGGGNWQGRTEVEDRSLR